MKKTEEKGITLIALIITIIVMLILVGVTVTVALNGGLFTTAKHAANRTTEEKERELIQAAYSDYNMQKYSMQKTDDFDMLETYFLGEAKTGLDINDLIDEEKSTDQVQFFKDIGISIKEKDLEYTDDGLVYIYFKYNDNMYRLIVKDIGAIAQKLEVMPKLQVQDATVEGNEREGWNITFNATGNNYCLLEDGRILKPWWRATDEEKGQMKVESEIYYYVSEGNNPFVVFDTKNENYQNCALVIMFNNSQEIYVYPLTKAYAQELQELTGVNCERFNWYHASDDLHFSNFSEYSGVSPISLDDFTEEQIYCKSYLERIIKSFN